MSDESDQQAAGVSTDAPAASAEDTAAGSQPVEQPSQQAEEGKPAEEAKPSAPTEQPVKQEFKPESRRSAKYRIEQLARENAELRKNQVKPQEQAPQEDFGDPQTDETQAPQPDLRQIAREEAERMYKPVLDQHRQAEDESELGALFSGDKAAKRTEYEPQIKDAWSKPELSQYKDLAAIDVFKILDYDRAVANAKLQAIEEYKKAELEAKESSGSGNSDNINRSGNTASQMTDQQLLEHNERVKAGKA